MDEFNAVQFGRVATMNQTGHGNPHRVKPQLNLFGPAQQVFDNFTREVQEVHRMQPKPGMLDLPSVDLTKAKNDVLVIDLDSDAAKRQEEYLKRVIQQPNLQIKLTLPFFTLHPRALINVPINNAGLFIGTCDKQVIVLFPGQLIEMLPGGISAITRGIDIANELAKRYPDEPLI